MYTQVTHQTPDPVETESRRLRGWWFSITKSPTEPELATGTCSLSQPSSQSHLITVAILISPGTDCRANGPQYFSIQLPKAQMEITHLTLIRPQVNQRAHLSAFCCDSLPRETLGILRCRSFDGVIDVFD